MTSRPGLGAGGKHLWDGVSAEHELAPWQQALLLEACLAKDRLDKLAP